MNGGMTGYPQEAQALSIRPTTLRERLRSEHDRLQERLDEVIGLLAKMDANPAVADLVDEVFMIVR